MNKKILVLILVLSLILISCGKTVKYELNGFEIEKLAESYYRIRLNVEKENVRSVYYSNIRYDPKELGIINVGGDVKDKILKANEIFIAMNPNANYTGKVTAAGLEIKKFISNPFLWNKTASAAFTEKFKDMGFKIKRCEDSNETTTVILLKTGDNDKVYYDKCVIVQGKDEEGMIRSADRLVLNLLGVY